MFFPELDGSEQLTGESIQPYLSLVAQLQWLVTLGCLVIHAQLQGIYGYVKETTISNRIQSNHYLSDMLSKHWDLLKTLPMITNLLMTCGPSALFQRSAFMESRMFS